MKPRALTLPTGQIRRLKIGRQQRTFGGRIVKPGTEPPIIVGTKPYSTAKPATTVWGHRAVISRVKVESWHTFATEQIFGAIQAASKVGTPQLVESIARMAATAITKTFEEALRQARVEAYDAGYAAGVAEGIARQKATQAAVEGAKTIFPRARHAIAKQEKAEMEALAVELQKYHGGLIHPEAEFSEDIAPKPVHSISGWVQMAGLVQGHLAVQFRGSAKTGGEPVVCVYKGPMWAGPAVLESLLNAPSAGKWIHAHCYRSPYELGGYAA